jgi:hypothetical protein
MILKQKTKIIVQLMFMFFSLPIACSGGAMNEQVVHYEKYSDVPDDAWQKLAKKSIYFGHQSVGFNILDGVSELIKEKNNIPLKIEEADTPKMFKPGVLIHSRLGENRLPDSKLNGFVKLVNKDGKNSADIMFFKFCYIDFSEKTDVEALFKDYQKAFEQLKKENPKTTFVHLTTPLTTIKQGEGVKGWIKRIIGRPFDGESENIKRHEFNEMIRTTYSGKEPLFDIAKIESTFPDGRRSTFESDGKTYYSLVPDYTYDGGHLNEVGKKIVAEQFLVTLVNLV